MFKFLFCLSIVAFFSDADIDCEDAHDADCAGKSIVLDFTTSDLYCNGYASCAGASIIVDSSDFADTNIYCNGEYSCANATIYLSGYSIYGQYVKCRGSYSCGMATIEDAMTTDVQVIDCVGKKSCFGATVKAPHTNCWGVNACSNSKVSIMSEINCYGFGSCMNGDWECGSSDGCTIQMQGTMASNNTNITCNDGGCTFECNLNGCYGLSVSGSATINKQCYNTWYSTLANDFCDESSTRDGIKYLLDISSVLSHNSEYYIPNLINNIDLFKEISEENVMDSTYYEYDNFDGSNDIDCSLYGEYYGIDYLQLAFDTLTIHNDNDDYNGYCCSGQSSCYSADFVVFANYSNNFNFINCDGYDGCSRSQFEFLENGASDSTMTLNIYVNGDIAAKWMDFYNTINNEKINVFADGGYGYGYGTMQRAENIYCGAAYSCVAAEITYAMEVFGYGYGSMYESTIENVANNVYCLSSFACYHSKLSNIGKNVYLFSYQVGSYTSISDVQGSVIAYGGASLYWANVTCTDSYVFCIGYLSCYNTRITTVSQGIIVYGKNSLYRSTIITKSGNHECDNNDYFIKNDYGIITIEIDGTMTGNSWITCSDGDRCAIYCQSSKACTYIYLYCNGNCFVICDGTDCPINGNGDTWWYSLHPTTAPTTAPSAAPSTAPTDPSMSPSIAPTIAPSTTPSSAPSIIPSMTPSGTPSRAPSLAPSIIPSMTPTMAPSKTPSSAPSIVPSMTPSGTPSSAPSLAPSIAPSNAPTAAPSRTPSAVPSQAPTNTYCDATIQTNSTYEMCSFFMLLQDLPIFLNDNINNELRSYDYCQTFPNYFGCDNDDGVITSLFFSECEINSEIVSSTMKKIPKTVSVIDFSNNNFYGNIEWSWLPLFKNLTKLNFKNNDFSVQTVDFDKFEHVSQLSFLDLSHNKFYGVIKLSHFSSIKYLRLSNNEFNKISDFDTMSDSLPNLEQFYIENNFINEQMELSWFPQNNNNLTIIHCYNNSLHGHMNLNDLPNTTVEFICGYNDFGTLTWTVDDSESEHPLKYLDLSDSNLAGELDMNVFDVNGEFGRLNYVHLNGNPNLNMSINFEYLSGSSIYIFNILNVGTYNKVDFGQLTSFIVIKMDKSVKCISSVCSDNENGETVSWTRNNDTCVGHSKCDDTCECVTPYAAGLESYEDDGTSDTKLYVLVCVIIFVVILIFLSFLHSQKYVKLPKLTQRDDFDYMACFGYLFQLWDFFSDGLLAYDMFDHYVQESYDSPAKSQYFACFVLCSSFILIPWTVNLVFLMKAKQGWKVANQSAVSLNDVGKFSDSLYQSQLFAGKWLTKYSKVLVILCMLSGGLASSLKVVNCKLFGLDAFNMGLSKYKQEESIRHRIWLTVLLENIPQIIINLLYAVLLLGEMDKTVLFALISSLASVVLALLSIKLEFPKHFYIYQMSCELSNNNDRKLKSKSKQTKKLAKSICEAMHQDASHVFVENVFIIDGGLSMIMNVVCHERLKLNAANNKSIVQLFQSKNKIEAVTNVDIVFRRHECIKLVHVKSVLCGNKNGVASPNESEMVETVKYNSQSPIKSETTSGMMTPGMASPGMTSVMTTPGMTTPAMAGHGDSNDSVNVTVVDVFMKMSTEGDRNIESRTKNSGDGENGNGKEWTCGQVCQWFESILLKMDDFKDNLDGIDNFIKLLKRQSVNGECILRMLNENDDFSKRMKQTLSSQCDCIGIWVQFEKEISKWQVNE